MPDASQITRRAFLAGGTATALAGCDDGEPRIRHANGSRYATLGETGRLSPVVFALSSDAISALTHGALHQVAGILLAKGFVAASVDLPAHGDDVRPGEPDRLNGWAYRTACGERLMPELTQRCCAALDDMVARRIADPSRVVVYGISRGAFCAAHFAAAEPRVRAVALLSPVTDLRKLEEFDEVVDIGERIPAFTAPAWMAVRQRDGRADTASALAYARRIGAEIRVVPGEGHGLDDESHIAAAEWLAAQNRP